VANGILAPQDYARWLEPGQPRHPQPQAAIGPAPEGWLTEWPVSRALNNPRHEGPDCAVELK